MKNCNILDAMKKEKLMNWKRDKYLKRSHFIDFKQVTLP